MQNIFFTSDFHFSHKNIVRFSPKFRKKLFWSKDFDFTKSLDEKLINEMDFALISQWNGVVGQNDLVYYLGDFSFKKDKTRKILQSLNGRKIFVQGNHDKQFLSGEFDDLLEKRVDYLEEKFSFTHNGVIENLIIIMSHYPIYEWNGMSRGAVHLHGHIHENDISHILGGRAVNVCWDRWGRILSLNDIFSLTKNAAPREYDDRKEGEIY
ncbi:metallophosphoesterase [Campylobacter geochelonis]|uniref:Predicted phosphoesterase or phosphohydrolase n=1 Tax=Campylobacter geochelonis TaxID=1780362 RepID=A0A128EN80_9BACT|nr:metallophosphoesterase [Campylobacter geochelonis]QKF70731.1 metallophosphoesterase [Campylobacter geochelonis]CZE47257.1 Predicted phosphoesterase or phosphohydrolase [Campylobacter geochelonis]CZE48571.1 Predicted phosphoesterase or phosphohydrolase [Campylobacter geochelonis]CZE50501.1 Predicted phosphoesterase or phosphohydrolase [Campylobacter geochelonis]